MGEGMSKLNGWDRIALIISVIAFFPLYLKISEHNFSQAIKSKDTAFERCMILMPPPIDKDNCLKESTEVFNKARENIELSSIFLTLFILVIFSGIFQVIGRLLEWVIEGFKKP